MDVGDHVHAQRGSPRWLHSWADWNRSGPSDRTQPEGRSCDKCGSGRRPGTGDHEHDWTPFHRDGPPLHPSGFGLHRHRKPIPFGALTGVSSPASPPKSPGPQATKNTSPRLSEGVAQWIQRWPPEPAGVSAGPRPHPITSERTAGFALDIPVDGLGAAPARSGDSRDPRRPWPGVLPEPSVGPLKLGAEAQPRRHLRR
jgi:hypothetical protein